MAKLLFLQLTMETKKKQESPGREEGKKEPEFLSKENVLISIAGAIACSLCLYILNDKKVFALPNVNIQAISCRVIGGLHGLFSFLSAFLYLRRYIERGTWHKLLSFSIGYFIFDIIRELIVTHTFTFATITEVYGHHLLLLAIIISCFKKYTDLMARGFLSELTNPILYVSWFLIKAKQQDTLLAKVTGVCLLFGFAIARIYNFTKIYLDSREEDNTMETAFFIPMIVVNYYWFYLILKKLAQALFFDVKVNF